MGALGFFLITGVLFSVALYAAGYYVWSIPEQEASERLGSRLRELRAHMRSRSQKAPELLRREHRGQFAFLGDLVTWVGVLRRLQTVIEQANLKYRAADVFGLSVALAVCCFLLTTLFGMMFFLRILFAVILGFTPVVYILQVRSRRMKKFEEMLPDAIDLFTRTMRAGHNIHSGLETIATETSDPVKMEFKKLMEELALGSQVEPALHSLGKRVPLLDLKFFITAPDPAAPDRREHGQRAGEPFHAGARALEHGGQDEGAHGPAAFLGRPAVLPASGGGHRILDPEAGLRAAAVDRPGGHQVFHLRDLFGDRGHPGDPQASQHQGMRMREC